MPLDDTPGSSSLSAGIASMNSAPQDDVLGSVPSLPTLSETEVPNEADCIEAPSVVLNIIQTVPDELAEGLQELCRNAPRGNVRFAAQLTGAEREHVWNVRFVKNAEVAPGMLYVQPSSHTFCPDPSEWAEEEPQFEVAIHYARRCEAFRGLGHVLGVTRDILKPVHEVETQEAPLSPRLVDPSGQWALDALEASRKLRVQEQAQFETLSTMIDCSRNGVLKVSTVKFLCRKLALVGYCQLMLYTEDTYQIESEPLFGYLRGGYSQAELKEIDDYAFALGIEIVPCIQTLGHMGQALQWRMDLRDTNEVLLADHAETYNLIEKMIATITAPLRTKKIHLGMDETYGLGNGRYRTIFGVQDATSIFLRHLKRVHDMATRRGLQTMIWSDMLWCLPARSNSLLGYYDAAQPPPVEGFPEQLDLVYWDYYHTSSKSYTDRIESHKQLSGKSPIMAAGSWTWTRFWTALPFTFATCKASQIAAKRKDSGVKACMLTIWGDEGCECDMLSSLPAWQYYAEQAYTPNDEVDLPAMRARFDGITGAHWSDWVMASRIDDVSAEKQSVDDRIHFASNSSKWLLWEEPILGFVSPSASGHDLESHFTELYIYLSERLSRVATVPRDDPTSAPRSILDHPLNARLRLPQLLAKVLSLKAGLRLRLHEAYLAQDWSELETLGGASEESRVSKLRKAVEQLHAYHCAQWHSTFKPMGWETLDLRYGGLRARLQTMQARICAFLQHLAVGGQVGTPLPHEHAAAAPSASETALHSLDEGVMLNPVGAQLDILADSLPELEVKLQVVYASAEQLLDYHRVSRPTYC